MPTFRFEASSLDHPSKVTRGDVTASDQEAARATIARKLPRHNIFKLEPKDEPSLVPIHGKSLEDDIADMLEREPAPRRTSSNHAHAAAPAPVDHAAPTAHQPIDLKPLTDAIEKLTIATGAAQLSAASIRARLDEKITRGQRRQLARSVAIGVFFGLMAWLVFWICVAVALTMLGVRLGR